MSEPEHNAHLPARYLPIQLSAGGPVVRAAVSPPARPAYHAPEVPSTAIILNCSPMGHRDLVSSESSHSTHICAEL
jgi:hypothetical protein